MTSQDSAFVGGLSIKKTESNYSKVSWESKGLVFLSLMDKTHTHTRTRTHTNLRLKRKIARKRFSVFISVTVLVSLDLFCLYVWLNTYLSHD